MRLATIASSVILLAFTAAATAAENHTFDLLSKGKKTATVSYTTESSKNGFKIHSTVNYVAETPNGARTIDYRVDPDGLLNSATLSSPQIQTIIFYKPSKTHDAISMSMTVRSENKGINNVTVSRPDYLFAFPDDASVWQTLLDVAKAHPHADKVYTLLALSSRDTTSRLEPFRLETSDDKTGKLDGKDITLQHYVLTFNGGKSHVYATPEGKLMQADIATFGVSHVRSNFTLNK